MVSLLGEGCGNPLTLSSSVKRSELPSLNDILSTKPRDMKDGIMVGELIVVTTAHIKGMGTMLEKAPAEFIPAFVKQKIRVCSKLSKSFQQWRSP